MVRALAQMLIAQRQLETSAELIALQERRLAAMERRVTAGETSRADLERVRADLADARRRHADADTKLKTGTVELANGLGVPSSALAGKTLVWDDLEAPAPAGSVGAQERRTSLLGRADLLKSIVAYDQAELDLRGEVAKQYPAITVGPGFTWERGLVKIPFNLGLSLPPFDLNRKAIAAAEARRTEAAARLEADYAAVAGAADTALAEERSAFAALSELRRLDLPVASRLAAQADRELAAGALDRADWGAARAGMLVVRLQELDALVREIAAEAAIEDALRKPLSGPELLIGKGAR
jgi:CRISPR system Cascade subunit CasA